ncbi:threonine synthase [Mesorhizobium sp. M0698]|uniref:threonine synthase n=1 Tax=Mesorhizobium sp. M0698 TaxID=2956987 RepID=UPI003336C104
MIQTSEYPKPILNANSTSDLPQAASKQLLAVCSTCGASYPAKPDLSVCSCTRQSNLLIRYSTGVGTKAALLASTGSTGRPSLWRYSPLLPAHPHYASRLDVGWTPLIEAGSIGRVRLLLKDETRNPSGSLKDRASEVVIALAAQNNIRNVIVASTGNAGASLACLGAARGISVTIIVPENVPGAKLAQSVAYGARVYRVEGTYDDAFNLASEVSRHRDVLNRNTGRNPYTREGKKTCAFEIAEQLGWQAPDWVVVPTGDGNILSGIAKGFEELFNLGMITSLPRLIAAQAKSSNAIARRYRGEHCAVAQPRTLADSISVSEPRDADLAVRALYTSRGSAIELADTEIIDAVHSLARQHGCFVEPSAAAAYAATERLVSFGMTQPGQTVVTILTGTGLKDLRPVLQSQKCADAPLVKPGEWQKIE